jgi:alpha-ketoglutarate-dependent taurine dioxygenase
MLVKNAALTTVPMTPTIGSRVEIGVDALLSGDHADEIKALLEERGVLIFPQIDLNDEQQLIFTETIGTQVDEYVGYMREDGERERIFKVSLDENVAKTAKGLQNSFFWHLDGSMQEVPIMASVLTAKKLSETGGDTEFCSTYAAYEALPEEDKQALEGLRVVHAAWALQRNADPQPSYEDFVRQRNGPSRSQPLVWKHRSGRNSLVIGATAAYIEGMDYLDSLDLLIRLRDWATQPRFVFRHKWTKGDMVMWDNTGTLHRALPYPPDAGRLMHRTVLQGEEPFA